MRCDAGNAYRCSFVGEVFISYLSNSYGISLLLDDCANDARVICHWQIEMHFFRVNAKEWNVDRCHRKSPGADDWSRDLRSAARVVQVSARCYYVPRESIVCHRRIHKYRRTFNLRPSRFFALHTRSHRSVGAFPRNFATGSVLRKSRIIHE